MQLGPFQYEADHLESVMHRISHRINPVAPVTKTRFYAQRPVQATFVPRPSLNPKVGKKIDLQA